ncbi:MAG: hypothetical protein PGN08_03955 [Sphingomonas taxi]
MIGALTMVALVGASPVDSCRIDHARYVLRAEPATMLRFHIVPKSRDWWSELAAELTLARNGRVSWWLPTASGTSDLRNFAWTALAGSPQAAPNYPYKLRGLHYFAFDRDYGMVNATLMKGDVAPAHILLTDLRDAFWYGDDPATRTSPPQSLFDLVACDVPDDRPNVLLPLVP